MGFDIQALQLLQVQMVTAQQLSKYACRQRELHQIFPGHGSVDRVTGGGTGVPAQLFSDHSQQLAARGMPLQPLSTAVVRIANHDLGGFKSTSRVGQRFVPTPSRNQ